MIVSWRESGAVEGGNPHEAEFIEYGFAALADRLAHGAAGSDGVLDFLCAHRDMDGAEEEAKVGRTAVVDERFECHEMELGVILRIVAY
jgi:hypothetical protein